VISRASAENGSAVINDGATSDGRPHFEVLDGLRGVAALLVVLFHLQGVLVDWKGADIPLHHGPLAVDFFFGLSGFVIGYAYDDRWTSMSARTFLTARLIRLHPLVILGALLGFASYVLDPFAGALQRTSALMLGLALVGNLLVVPSVPLPRRWLDTHALNGPAWSLFQEYIANIAYALFLRRSSLRTLAVLAAVGAGLLVLATGYIGFIDAGSSWDGLFMAPIRLLYPFTMGLILYRVRDRLPKVRLGLAPLALILIAAFAAPTLSPVAGIKINGLYEAACVILLFPLIVIAGAHSDAGAGMERLCRFSGRISYPLYMTHYPFVYVFWNFATQTRAAPEVVRMVQLALPFFLVGFAYTVLKLYDEPVRARLKALARPR
jgi:peptidoglycan/LPS O-acetylase OafA/YrhL